MEGQKKFINHAAVKRNFSMQQKSMQHQDAEEIDW